MERAQAYYLVLLLSILHIRGTVTRNEEIAMSLGTENSRKSFVLITFEGRANSAQGLLLALNGT